MAKDAFAEASDAEWQDGDQAVQDVAADVLQVLGIGFGGKMVPVPEALEAAGAEGKSGNEEGGSGEGEGILFEAEEDQQDTAESP